MSETEIDRAERQARVERRGERFDGTFHFIHDENERAMFGLHDIEESADVRVVRVTILPWQDWIIPPCPSDSPRIATSEREVNMRVVCSEEKRLFDLLYEVRDGRRLLDALEEKLDLWMKRKSDLARLVDVYFSRMK